MTKSDFGEVIAERELSFTTEDGQQGRILVQLGMPRPFAEPPDYYASYRISGLGAEISRQVGGVDGFQAVLLALRLIATELAVLTQSHRAELAWECGADGDLGFLPPV